MHIAVIGTGYVGLVSAACFAELGHTVHGVDIDPAKIDMLRRGESPIYEPGLEEVLKRGLESKRLSFTTNITDVLPHVQILFCAVATPSGESHKADLRAVFAVTESVAKAIDHDLVFVNKSTVPVGTGKECEERFNKILNDRGQTCRIAVVSNPEFLREGMAVSDTLMPDRIVVGTNGDTWAHDLMEELYRPITRVGKPIVFMNRQSAEIVKYASNAFLATKISFINMMSELAEKTGADIRDIAKGMGLDDRIGPRFLHAGIGYGGSCFPKDVKALMATAKEYALDLSIVEATDRINYHQRERFFKKILDALPSNARVAIFGLAFKPKTDDMRDAPSLDVLPALIEKGHTVYAYDPAAMEKAKPMLPATITYADSPLHAATGADAIVILTEWDEFRGIDLKELKQTMKGSLLFDGRNIYEPAEARAAGFVYTGIGLV
jgi:UDPglucose 6-dehydrogenase